MTHTGRPPRGADAEGPSRLMGKAWRNVTEEASRALRAVRAVRHPGRERDLLAQSMKSALAALVAWALASWAFSNGSSLMAPWVAVVLVQATVYRSWSEGARQAAAIALGTALATGTALIVGHPVVALVLVLPITLLLGNAHRFGSQGVYVATSAIFALVGGPITLAVSAERVASALIGAVVGIGVNSLVRPPRYLRDARAALLGTAEETAEVLAGLAEVVETDEGDAREWQWRADRLPQRVDAVRSALEWDRESLRLNMRRRHESGALPTDYTTEGVVHTLHEVVDHTRGLAHAVVARADRADSEPALPPELAQTYARILTDLEEAVRSYGSVVVDADSSAGDALSDSTTRAASGLDRLVTRIDVTGMPDVGAMEVLGPLLAETRRLVHSLSVS